MIDRNTVLNLAIVSTDISEYLMTIYNLVVQGNYKTVVELGAGYSTAALLAGVNKTEGQLYSFDAGEGSIDRSGLKDELYKESRFHFIQGMVHDSIKSWNQPIDFLLHDLSHIYEATRDEIRDWFPFVRSGGMIFAHDQAHESGDIMGCRRAYDEFMATVAGKQYRTIQLLDTKIIGASVSIKL